MSNYHVYGIGAALVDTEIEVSDQDLVAMNVDKGVMTLVDEERQHQLLEYLEGHLVHANRASGGSAANSIIAASYFGANAFYSCKVADDENGHFYLDDIRAAGVDSNFSSGREVGITGKCLVMITPDAERSMNTFLGISETLSSSELNVDAITQSDYVYLEGYLVTSPTGRQAAIETKKVAEQNGTLTAISLSDPGMVEFFKDGLLEMIGDGVDLLFCNEAEAKGWAGTDQLDEAIETLKKTAARFAVTLGKKGALVFDGEQLITIDPYPVNAIDTNGAGDMFAGAFLYAITHGYSYAEAGKLASRAAAEVVSDWGPRLPKEKHAQLLEILQ